MRKVSVIAITATYLDMTFATTANITSVVETGGYFVRTVICTIIWASFPMSLVNDMKGEPMNDLISRQAAIDAITRTSGIRADALKALYDVPPVTPKSETVTEFADRCRECGREKVLDKIRAEIEQEYKNECEHPYGQGLKKSD